jgi:hypothetical protein
LLLHDKHGAGGDGALAGRSQAVYAIWQQCYLWSFPYYLVGAGIAGLVSVSGQYVGWKTALLIVPIMYLVYLHYRMYVERQTVNVNVVK